MTPQPQPDVDIKHIRPASDSVRLSQLVDTFANIVEFANDDAGCFFALALLMNDLTNLARPKDPAGMIRDLNQFFLNVECEDGSPLATSPVPAIPAGGVAN